VKDKTLLAFLALVVIASGCGQATNTDSSSNAEPVGVSVQNFTTFPPNPYSGESVTLRLTLQNDGDATAEDVSAEFFNVPLQGQGNIWSLEGEREISFSNLRPADEEANLPADRATERWDLTAPNLNNGVTIPYNLKANLFYGYETTGNTQITLMSRDRYSQRRERSRPSLENTDGPVQMRIMTRTPILYNENSDICVSFSNDGTGTPFIKNEETYSDGTYTVESSDMNKVRLTIEDQGNIDFTASDADAGQSVVVDNINRATRTCYEIEVESGNLGPQTEVPVFLTAEYGYMQEATAPVDVRGDELLPEDNSGSESDTSGDDGDESSGDSPPDAPE